MKATYALALSLAAVLALVGCGPRRTGPAGQTGAAAPPPPAPAETWSATLAGGNEVPPADTMASGTATFTHDANAGNITYNLNVQSISDVTEAHLHMGKPGENGEVVVWLYPDAPPPSTIRGPLDGVLAQGSIDAARLTGPLQGKTVQDLIDAMNAGDIYVNVHTEAHPDGEIRGQVEIREEAPQATPMNVPEPEASPNAP